MATMEKHGLLRYKDDAGNLYILYPVCTAEDVDGLEEALAGKLDKTGGTVTGTLTAGGALAISGYGTAAPAAAVSNPVAGQLYVQLV